MDFGILSAPAPTAGLLDGISAPAAEPRRVKTPWSVHRRMLARHGTAERALRAISNEKLEHSSPERRSMLAACNSLLPDTGSSVFPHHLFASASDSEPSLELESELATDSSTRAKAKEALLSESDSLIGEDQGWGAADEWWSDVDLAVDRRPTDNDSWVELSAVLHRPRSRSSEELGNVRQLPIVLTDNEEDGAEDEEPKAAPGPEPEPEPEPVLEFSDNKVARRRDVILESAAFENYSRISIAARRRQVAIAAHEHAEWGSPVKKKRERSLRPSASAPSLGAVRTAGPGRSNSSGSKGKGQQAVCASAQQKRRKTVFQEKDEERRRRKAERLLASFTAQVQGGSPRTSATVAVRLLYTCCTSRDSAIGFQPTLIFV